jgi:hypothetical protein
MAVGTVSGLNLDEEWQLIATNTPSAAASTAFSSISGYKKLMLAFKGVTTSVGGPLRMSFNGDTTANNYASTAFWGSNGQEGSQNWIVLGVYAYTTQQRGGYAVIENVNKSMVHPVSGAAMDTFTLDGVYLIQDPITSVTVTGPGGTLTGTFYLYGIAA